MRWRLRTRADLDRSTAGSYCYTSIDPDARTTPNPCARHADARGGCVCRLDARLCHGCVDHRRDLTDRLSTTETDCIRAAFGEAIYQIILATPLLQSGNAEGAATLFGCLMPDSVVFFGVAFDNALAGGRTEETRACRVDLSLDHPELVYQQLGLEWKGEEAGHSGERHTFILQQWDCLTNAETAELFFRVNSATDSASPLTGSDLGDLFAESEVACIREGLSEEQFDAMLAATPLESVRIGAPAAACLSPESIASGFLAAAEVVVGGLTDGSANCINEYILEYPTFLPLFVAYPADTQGMSPNAAREIADGNRAILACYNEDELLRAQELALEALRR